MIRIQNIYYMLAYAFRVLNEQAYKSLETEEFHNTGELCAAILSKGISTQLKRGFQKEYLPKTEALSSLRGKIHISDSIKTQTYLKTQMICTYDEFTVNSYMNRIIKSTVMLLLKYQGISKERKKELRKLMVFFDEVELIDFSSVNWNLQYSRNNQTYRMLITICYLVVKGLLQTQSDGAVKMMDFLDEQRMHHLYEKFILEYYRKEHKELTAYAKEIKWKLDNEADDKLPAMQSDIMLSRGKDILIIDAKYYSHTMQKQYGKNTLHSNNLYQIFTYVKNQEVWLSGENHKPVAGMLLYAKTDEEEYPENIYQMSGNTIEVRTLNLDADFDQIKDQLDKIAESYLGEVS